VTIRSGNKDSLGDIVCVEFDMLAFCISHVVSIRVLETCCRIVISNFTNPFNNFRPGDRLDVALKVDTSIDATDLPVSMAYIRDIQ